MISLVSFGLVTLIASQAALAANPCGEPAGVFRDQLDTPHALVSREIHRFRSGDHFVYSYRLTFAGVLPTAPIPRDGQTYAVAVGLNGRATQAVGQMLCTTVSTIELSDGRCEDPSTEATPDLFFYARNGETLNAWDLTIRTLNPVTSRWEVPAHLRFEQKSLSDLTWGE
jgi:hypothetical protein